MVVVDEDEHKLIGMHFVCGVSKSNDRNLGMIRLIIFFV